MKTKWQLHVEKWKSGCGGDLCKRANKVCLAGGSVPCAVLFVGEGPGDSENVIGTPFVGPAGSYLHKYVIRKAIPHDKVVDVKTKEVKWIPSIRYALTNIVGCMPTDEAGLKSGAPEEGDIIHCAPRLLDLIDICSPKLIVCVGREAATAMDQQLRASVWNYSRGPRHEGWKIPRIEITHPVAILRQNISVQQFKFHQAALAVEMAIEEYVVGSVASKAEPPPKVYHTDDDIPF